MYLSGTSVRVHLRPVHRPHPSAPRTKVQPKSAGELFKVALAKLQLSDKVEPASRTQVHNEMKNAPKFYKSNMHKNSGNTISALMSAGEINEPTAGNFALTAKAQKEMRPDMPDAGCCRSPEYSSA